MALMTKAGNAGICLVFDGAAVPLPLRARKLALLASPARVRPCAT